MHERGYLHRDIKPCNIMLGLGDKQKIVHLVDFGLSRKFYDPVSKVHILRSVSDSDHITGTPEFASVNTHRGIT
jgi:serine/threonine protein kinase